MNIHVLTLFPEMISAGVDHSIVKRARDKGLCTITAHQIRDYAENKHRQVDDMPYGGGAGMVLACQPLFSAIQSLNLSVGTPIIYMSPKGQTLTQERVKSLAALQSFVLVCGHYEGLDQRVIDHFQMEELSIGDYVLTGGELAALVVVDAVVRLKDGVLGDSASHQDESFENHLLEYPHYTRPEVFNALPVPDVLLSGNHSKIKDWRLRESLLLTKTRRPDLFQSYMASLPSDKARAKTLQLMASPIEVTLKRKKAVHP